MALNLRAGLFLGTETFGWSLAQFSAAAQRARALGVDTLLVKIADGTEVWYANLGGGDAWAGVWNVLSTIKSQGVQVLPYFFSYGNQFGAFQGEVNLANYVLSHGFDVCLDMETAWNGQDVLAGQLAAALSGPVWVSTWADPALQNWDKVLRALAPKTRYFLPQVYTSFLEGVWQQQYSGAGIPDSQIIPTLNSQSLGGASGREAITLWEYQQLSDAQITSAVQALGGTMPQGPFVFYTVGAGGVPSGLTPLAISEMSGLTVSVVLQLAKQPANYDPTIAFADGTEFALPGFPQPAPAPGPAPQAKLVIDADSIRAVIA